MIRFGLRLSIAGGREAVIRLVTIAAAVAIGVGLLLSTIGGLHAVSAQSDRYAWLNTGLQPASMVARANGVAPTLWYSREDYVAGEPIARIDVAATGSDSPVPPGIAALPAAGQYYASPKLAELIRSRPAAQLADRYPGTLAGIIGDDALPSPDALIVVVGHRPTDMPSDASKVTRIFTVVPRDCGTCAVGLRASGYELVLAVVIAALLFPVLIFIGAATRLTAARREERFAAMRLMGATPRQISTIASTEMTSATVIGTAAGFALFYAVRDQVARIPFTGQAFFPSDLSLGPLAILIVALGIPAAAAVAARLALRRVKISPLGVSRRVTPRPPRAWRLAVGPVGLAFLGFWVLHGVPESSIRQVEVFLPGILTVMIGLVLAGPWLTMAAARILARRSRRPAALIAARRLADNPAAAFRAVSGLVVALFVTTVAVGILTTLQVNRGGDLGGTARTVMQQPLYDGTMTSIPQSVLDHLSATPGVRAALVIRQNPQDAHGTFLTGFYDGLVPCADLATDPALGRCRPGGTIANVDSMFDAHRVGGPSGSVAWPTLPLTVAQFAAMPVIAVVADTDGSSAALESARTILDNAFPDARPAASEDDWNNDFTRTSVGFRQLAYVVSLASLPIAGCSLAVSVAGGLSERKRPFGLLRLTGVPLRLLRRVVAFESAVPLLLVALAAIGLGLVAAQLFLKAQMHYTLSPPGLGYYMIVAIGLMASLAIIGATLPLLSRMTGPEVTRND